MIRPITIATFLMACGSGLYLYQSKHEVQVLDRTIEHTVRDTAALREQTRILATEWTMLNDPERLHRFANEYLKLRPIDPAQFASVADLDARLPSPQTGALPDGQPPVPVADAEFGNADPAKTAPVAVAETHPTPSATVPPLPARPIVASEKRSPPRSVEPPAVHARPAAEPRLAAKRPAAEPRPTYAMAEPRPTHATAEPRPTRAVETRVAGIPSVLARPRPAPRPPAQIAARPQTVAEPRPTVARPAAGPRLASAQPTRPTPTLTAPPLSGSLLGMAHASAMPAPQPTPVNATFNAD